MIKKEKSYKLFEILFSLFLILISLAQLIAGVLGWVYMSELGINSNFWFYFLKCVIITWTISSGIFFIGICLICGQAIFFTK